MLHTKGLSPVTNDTAALITRLAAELRPVTPLAAPGRRVAAYLAFASGVLLLLLVLRGLRLDLGDKAASLSFALGIAGGLLTGATGAMAALLLAAADRSRLWILLPLPALALWLGAVGTGCLAVWVPITPGVVTLQEVSNCFLTVVLAGTPLSLGMIWLLRRAMPLRPTLPVLAATLAASGMTSAALSLLHSIDPSAMILIWNGGILAMIAAGQAWSARRALPQGINA